MTARTVPIGLVRATAELAAGRGWDVDELLRAAGISPMLLAGGRSRVTEEQVIAMVQRLWRLTDDEMFGLGRQPLPRGSFRLLSYGLLGSSDLGSLLERLAGFVRVIPALPEVVVSVHDGVARVEVDLDLEWLVDEAAIGPEHLVRPLVVCASLAVLHRLMAWATGTGLPLGLVELPYPAQEEELHTLVFGAPLRFDARSPAISFDAAQLAVPMMRTDSELEEFIKRSPAGLMARVASRATVTERVSRMTAQALPGPAESGERIARRLSMSRQTLHRRLSAEGTSVRRIREEVLRDAAVTSLVRGDESIADLAARLGFSEPSAFTRAFKRWTGSPPSVYRLDRVRPGQPPTPAPPATPEPTG
jgi:AraC-like DNA-binding protein